MRILVLGGDGYCGWATALHLSTNGHDVAIMDSQVRRAWDWELGTQSLTPIADLPERVKAWHHTSGHLLRTYVTDVCDWSALEGAVRRERPQAIVHFAEQRSAPYSMIDREHAVRTQVDNVRGTLNILYAIKTHVPECHLVKLGTMGEYGTPDIDIEEGWLDVQHNGRSDRMLYPKRPGSWYHASKVHDSTNIELACRIWGLRATDLNQGVVYGVHTDETACDDALINRMDYDGIFGTVLNRFIAQAAFGCPMTVYGEGGQTRGFIDIRDTVRCIALACERPPVAGEFRVFNQFTEQFSVLELANLVQRTARGMGFPEAQIEHVPNPRVEAEQHYYHAAHTKLESLGLVPHRLQSTLLESLMWVADTFRARIDRLVFDPHVDWRSARNQVAARRTEVLT